MIQRMESGQDLLRVAGLNQTKLQNDAVADEGGIGSCVLHLDIYMPARIKPEPFNNFKYFLGARL